MSASTKKRPAARPGASPALYTPVRPWADGPNSTGGGPSGPCKVLFHCPVCGHPKGDIWLRGEDKSSVSCWVCEAQGPSGGDYLRALAVEVGAPHGAAILEDPLRWLGTYVIGSPGGPHDRKPEELPSVGSLAGGASRLASDENARGYCYRRGLTDETMRRVGLVRVEGGLGFPVFAGGELVNFVTHRPKGKPKYASLRGHPAAFYPSLPGRGKVLLVAGMFDALVARQNGVAYATTTTCGATLPGHLVPLLSGRPVAVAYYTGEDEAAERTVARLRAAGGEAWVVRLGLPEPGDDPADWFVRYRRTAAELKRLIGASRRAA